MIHEQTAIPGLGSHGATGPLTPISPHLGDVSSLGFRRSISYPHPHGSMLAGSKRSGMTFIKAHSTAKFTMHCSVTTRYRSSRGLNAGYCGQSGIPTVCLSHDMVSKATPQKSAGSLLCSRKFEATLVVKPQTHGSDRHPRTGVRVPVVTLGPLCSATRHSLYEGMYP